MSRKVGVPERLWRVNMAIMNFPREPRGRALAKLEGVVRWSNK